MTDDLTEQAWWTYETPGGGILYQPAPSEETARERIKAMAYKGADVDSWHFIASRWTSRSALIKSILGRPVMPGQAPSKEP